MKSSRLAQSCQLAAATDQRQDGCFKLVGNEKLLATEFRPYRHWVSLQDGVNLAEVEELILLQVARLSPHGVQHRSRVALEERKGQPLSRRRSSGCHFIQIQNSQINLLEYCVFVCVCYFGEDETVIA